MPKRQCVSHRASNIFRTLPEDTVRCVIAFLCYVDFMALLFASPNLYKVLQNLLVNKLESSLIKHLAKWYELHDAVEMLRIVDISNAFVTGSFLLCCMFEEHTKWLPEDIDIIAQSCKQPHYYNKFTDPFLENLSSSSLSDTTITTEAKEVTEQASEKYYFSQRVPRYISTSTNTLNGMNEEIMYPFMFDCLHSNLLPINRIGCFVEPLTFIDIYFDLSFCKVAFSNKKLYVRDWNSLFTRRGHVDILQNFKAVHDERLFRYISDYPDIVDNPNCQLVQGLKQLHCDRLFLRQIKYQKRGFSSVFASHARQMTLADLHYRCADIFPQEMMYLKMVDEYQTTGILPIALTQIQQEIGVGVASRFTKLLGFDHFPYLPTLLRRQ